MKVRDLAGRIQRPDQVAPKRGSPAPKTREGSSSSFADALQQAQRKEKTADVRLSAHAADRLRQRGIPMSDAQRMQLSDAMNQLATKGSRDAVLLRSDAAFVVNVPNRTVVTAMGQDEMQQRVFTQIDSAFVLQDEA
ncbi:MAG: TIGR02530 family flagellar biosynthesis protein [Candidatus Wenzhouxiangella sp. M2_3B_020]